MKLLNKHFKKRLQKMNIEEGLINRALQRYNRHDLLRKISLVIFYIGLAIMLIGLAVFYLVYFLLGLVILGIAILLLLGWQAFILYIFKTREYGKTVDFLNKYADGKPVSLSAIDNIEQNQMNQSESKSSSTADSLASSISQKINEVKEKLETRSENVANAATPAIGASEKYSKIRSRSEVLIEMMKKFPCSKGDLKSIKMNDEYDSQEGCKGPAVYVCHHCKTSLCSTHSYWIPDKEFPYYTFASTKRPVEDNSSKIKVEAKSKITVGMVIFILAIIMGFIPFVQLVSPFIFIASIPLLMNGWNLFYMSEYKPVITNPYPEFIDTYYTKWGNSIEKRYALLGNYTAVHCWNCLLKFHAEFIEISKNIFTMVLLDANAWKKCTEFGYLDYTESDKIKAANFAANLYLNDFKFASAVLVPEGNRLKPMERPVEYRVQLREDSVGPFRWFMPTPVWLNEPNISKVEIDKEQIAERVKKTTLIISIIYLALGIIGSVIGMLFYLPLGIGALLICLGGFAFGCWKALSATKNIDRSTTPDPNTIYRWYDRYRGFIKYKLNSA